MCSTLRVKYLYLKLMCPPFVSLVLALFQKYSTELEDCETQSIENTEESWFVLGHWEKYAFVKTNLVKKRKKGNYNNINISYVILTSGAVFIGIITHFHISLCSF